ncbi:MAG: hypothetical protein BMS9Abin26_0004 [Gammaproteobacteria bacterium]|nr:MAG: hypothetical protein BMS9Abin26_0004 [Gammaproteobacteria bacterium]
MGVEVPKYEDYNDWPELAERDPEAFEARRKAVIDGFINSASKERQVQLRRLQWRIDVERSRASNPVSSCIRIYKMMWESFAGDNGLIAAFERAALIADGRTAGTLERAPVLSLDAHRAVQARVKKQLS